MALLSMHFGACAWYAVGLEDEDVGWMTRPGVIMVSPSQGPPSKEDWFVRQARPPV